MDLKRAWPAGIVIFLALGCREKHDHATDSQAKGAPAANSAAPVSASNPVRQEMQLLTTALEGAVRGIGLGNVRPLEHALHRVHSAKDATEAALESGSYRLPKNPDRVAKFRELDEAFHNDLVRLVKASRANNLAATADALSSTLKGCQGCHSEFRP